MAANDLMTDKINDIKMDNNSIIETNIDKNSGASHTNSSPNIEERFRGYLPIVVDIETGGFNSATDAMLEIAATVIKMDEHGTLFCGHTYSYHVKPFEGSNIDPAALEFTGINPDHPLRPSQDEKVVLDDMFSNIRGEMKSANCKRSIMVAHNSSFDQGFLNAAIERCKIKRSPFHPFSSFDTATLAGLALGQTVLAKACFYAGIEFDNEDAHSASYDTLKTAELFCFIVNRWKTLGGWPLDEK